MVNLRTAAFGVMCFVAGGIGVATLQPLRAAQVEPTEVTRADHYPKIRANRHLSTACLTRMNDPTAPNGYVLFSNGFYVVPSPSDLGEAKVTAEVQFTPQQAKKILSVYQEAMSPKIASSGHLNIDETPDP